MPTYRGFEITPIYRGFDDRYSESYCLRGAVSSSTREIVSFSTREQVDQFWLAVENAGGSSPECKPPYEPVVQMVSIPAFKVDGEEWQQYEEHFKVAVKYRRLYRCPFGEYSGNSDFRLRQAHILWHEGEPVAVAKIES